MQSENLGLRADLSLICCGPLSGSLSSELRGCWDDNTGPREAGGERGAEALYMCGGRVCGLLSSIGGRGCPSTQTHRQLPLPAAVLGLRKWLP